MQPIPLVAAALIISLTEAASAQSLQYFSPSGAYLTGPVRKAFDQARATEFSRAASAAGFSAGETRVIAAGIREGKVTLIGVPGADSAHAGTTNPGPPRVETPRGRVSLLNFQQLALVQRTFDPVQYSWFFARYATIHVAVNPAAPLDYNITINGESCPPTRASIYQVLPGKAVVSVTRSGKQPCTWTGTMSVGKLQDLACRL